MGFPFLNCNKKSTLICIALFIVVLLPKSNGRGSFSLAKKMTRNLQESEIFELLNADSESDLSNLDYEVENCETSEESEVESEPDEIEGSASDPLFTAKNKMVWSATPFATPIRTTADNILSTRGGATLYATSRCSDMMSAFLLFFQPPIERIIIEYTNKNGRFKYGDKWEDIDVDLLRAYVAVLILAGVCRYVHSFCAYFYFFLILILL